MSENKFLERAYEVAVHAHKQGLADLQLEEKALASLILNRADWLEVLGLTIVEAIDMIDYAYMQFLSTVQDMVVEFIEISVHQ